MQRVIFTNRMKFSAWVVGFLVFGLVMLVLSQVTGEIGPMFLAFGVLWIGVAVFVAIVIALAGGAQIASVTLDGEHSLIVESNGLFGRGRERHLPLGEIRNWQWLSQASNSKGIGPKLYMLAFEHDGRVYRLPLTTAQMVDMAAFRTLAPAVVDDLSTRMPSG